MKRGSTPALPEAKTLQEAFERAKAAIAVRERKEHETPSEPQAFFGSAISGVLDRNPMRSGKHGREAVTADARERRVACGVDADAELTYTCIRSVSGSPIRPRR